VGNSLKRKHLEMNSTRCHNCDFLNFTTQTVCRRCRATLAAPGNYTPSDVAGPERQYRPEYYPPAPNAYPSPPYQQTAVFQAQAAWQPAHTSAYANMLLRSQPQGVWQRRGQVIMLKDAELPDSCVKCNAPVRDSEKVKVRLYWHHPALYVALVSPLIYAIMAAIFTKRATIYAGLCKEHRASRDSKLTAGLSLVIGGFFGGFYFLANGPVELSVISFLLVVIGGIVLCFLPPLKAEEIDDTRIWLKGAGRAFCESLPPWEQRGGYYSALR
jgi:hypothetical protein